jgi:hypothetical protein
MKPTILPLFFLVAAALPLPEAVAANDAPRVTRSMLIDVEKALDTRVSKSTSDNPFLLLGPTRGVYLEGYGAVFTAEINLVAISAPALMFKPMNTKEQIEEHRKKKVARLPELRRAIREAIVEAAAMLKTLPPDQQVVFVALMAKYPWEDVTGLPQQIMMQATKKQLMDARDNDAALTAAIHVIDNN